MFAEVFHFNRAEGAKPGMQCDFCEPDAFNLQLLDQFNTKVQSGSWCCNSTFMFCIHCLVPDPVFFVGFAFDIFWQVVFRQGSSALF